MTRCYSGLHFMDLEALDAALAETHEQVSELEQSKSRLAAFQEHLDACGGDLAKLAESYKTFGLQRDGSEWTYCEWMPYAAAVYLVGDFNGWDTSATPLAQEESLPDIWSCSIPTMPIGSKYKLYVVPEDGDAYYAMPAWATRFTGPNDM
ncbi:glgB, partial [Symbiodinium necroappetens]